MARARAAAGVGGGKPLLLLLPLLLALLPTALAWRATGPLPLAPRLSPLRTTTTATPRRPTRPLNPHARPSTPALHAATMPIIATTSAAATAIPFPATLGHTLGPLAAGLQASPWWTWTMLLLASTAGVAAERTRLGAALSSPLITMGVALIGCNLGLLPAAAPVRACAGGRGCGCTWMGAGPRPRAHTL